MGTHRLIKKGSTDFNGKRLTHARPLEHADKKPPLNEPAAVSF
jgi:hypothetical protein